MYYAFSTASGTEFQCEHMTDVFCITHVHEYLELIFVLDGEIEILNENSGTTAAFGEMAIIMPYEVHGFKTYESSEILVMEFPVEFIAEYNKLFKGKTFKNRVVDMSSNLKNLICELIGDENRSVFDKKAIIYRAVSEFLKKTELIDVIDGTNDIFTKTVIYISENFAEDISEKSVAEAIGVSAGHLSRVLSKQHNFGFAEILNSARAKEAKTLMETTDLSVSEVAFAVGFGSIRNFNRICKIYFNCTPKELRKPKKVEFMIKKTAALI